MEIMTTNGWQRIRIKQPVIQPGEHMRSMPNPNPSSISVAYLACMDKWARGGYGGSMVGYSRYRSDQQMITRGQIPAEFTNY